MSILVSKLVSVFTADTHDLKKGYDETKRGAKEVTRELKNTEDQANRTAESFLSMAKKAAGFLAAAVAAGKSAQQIISEAANIVALDNFAYTIDESIESVDAFSKAIVSMGGSADEAQSTLSELFSKVKEASEDSASSAALDFAKIGVSIKDAEGNTRTLLNVLYDISGAVEGMDPRKAREYIESVGITDRNVVEAMMRGRKELEQMIRTQKELGVVSKESAENARAFDAAVGKLSVELQRAKEAITDAVLPFFTWFVEKGEKAVKFINENKEVFKGFFYGVAAVVTAVMIPTMWRLAASVLAATWPLLLIAAIVGLVGAAIWMLKEDFEAYKNGNKSMIGELIKDFEVMGKGISDTFEGIKNDFIQVFKDMWNGIQPSVYKIEQALSAITMGTYKPKFGPETQFEQGVRFSGLESEVPNMFGDNSGPVEYLVYEDGEVVGKITPEQYEKGEYLHLLKNKKNIDEIKAKRGIKEPETVYDAVVAEEEVNVGIPERGGMPSIEETLNKATGMFEQLAINPLNKMTSQQIGASNTNTEVNIGDISIHTQATDANGIANEFSKRLEEELKNIIAESATGIAR